MSDLSDALAARPALTVAVTACAAAASVWLLYRWKRQPTPRKVATVTGLFIYPIKSCQGTPVRRALCEARGFRFDHRWVIVDTLSKDAPSGTVGVGLSQKQQPMLAQIKPTVEADGSGVLYLNAPSMSELAVDTPSPDSPAVRVYVGRMEGEAIDCGDAAASWLTEFIKDMPGLRLYFMGDDNQPRKLTTDPKWGSLETIDDQGEVAFASFSAYHLINEKSLAELNNRLSEAVDTTPFRANIIVDSCDEEDPYSEDTWMNFTIGGVPFHFVKKTGRCLLTTLDQKTGRSVGAEPLKTLREYRVVTDDTRYGPGSPCFGVNIGSLARGYISVGDEVFLC